MQNRQDLTYLVAKTIRITTQFQVINDPTGGKLYCGRHKSRNANSFNPLDLGLGNPFSHKNTNNCVWKADNLAQCLAQYKIWLWKLIKNEHNQENLADWERMYLYRFLNLSNNLENYDTLVCFCVNLEHSALDQVQERCHTQILWNAAVWYRLNSIK